MKRLITITAAFLISIAGMAAETKRTPLPSIPIRLNGMEWGIVADRTWSGTTPKGTKMWYRLEGDSATRTLYFSSDSIRWAIKYDQTWFDIGGNQIRMVKGKTLYAEKGEYKWMELKSRAWQDAEGNWLMLESDARIFRVKE